MKRKLTSVIGLAQSGIFVGLFKSDMYVIDMQEGQVISINEGENAGKTADDGNPRKILNLALLTQQHDALNEQQS